MLEGKINANNITLLNTKLIGKRFGSVPNRSGAKEKGNKLKESPKKVDSHLKKLRQYSTTMNRFIYYMSCDK
jgi:hypothetical protein